MTRPGVDPGGLRKPAAWEWLVRFAFGGAIAVAAGIVARLCGPALGGMLLAFPAILPASLTLVRRHDGRRAAADDARGAELGAIALAVFAIVVASLAGRVPAPLVLGAATLAWIAVAVALWFLREGRT